MSLMATQANADSVYGFSAITANNVADTTTGEAQLQVTVQDLGGNQVGFLFTNSGPNASSITDVYFDDGSLLGIHSIADSGDGVSFTEGASPGDLPGGNTINFNESGSFFTADSDSPTQPNGVNPGEWVLITFNLDNNQTYADTIAAINLGLANPGVDMEGGLRIGIHVQGFDGGGSESFVNGNVVPLPAAVWGGMALCGFIGAAKIRRRQNSDSAA